MSQNPYVGKIIKLQHKTPSIYLLLISHESLCESYSNTNARQDRCQQDLRACPIIVQQLFTSS